ncbi:MAG: cohesin domain-containing protein [Gammaproteobacteria bacterium]
MNKIWLKTNAMLLGCLIYSHCNVALASITVRAEPLSSILLLGETTDVNVLISGLGANAAPSLGAFDIDVTFDAAVLDYVGSQFGGPAPLGDQLDMSGLGSLSALTDISPGTLNFYEVSLDDTAMLNDQQADSFMLFTFNVKALALGSSQIGININSLGDADGNPLPAEIQFSTITVESVPLPGSVWLFAAVLTAWLGTQKRQGQHLPS